MAMTAKVPPVAAARVVERVRHHLYRLNQRLMPAPAAMMEMIVGTWLSQAITVAAELGVADALAAGPMTIDKLAADVGADSDALGRLLRALVGRGVFRHRRDGRYELNSIARTLCSDAEASMSAAAQFYGSREQRDRWTLLADSIRTGRSVVPMLHGKEGFDYFVEDPQHADLFNRTMASISRLTDASVTAAYDFGGYPTIVDVGGGHGLLLATILAATPDVRGVVYDLPDVVSTVSNIVCYTRLAGRVRIEAGSFFDKVPAGGDAYVLKNILHDWPDDKAVQILRNVHAAAGRRATVLLVELVIPDHDRDFPGKWADLEMLLNLGARERTAAEYRKLLGQAGFEMTRLVATASPLSLLEARAV
ncbi:methyltransferase [Mycobacterium sp.]|uniref:methyltransferase n=1 Tax=Mycobacterium sp. TaxID=1785 RepID=UPI003D0BC1CC